MFTAHFVHSVTFLPRTHPTRTLHFGHGQQVVCFSCLMVKWTATQTVGANAMSKLMRTLLMAGLAMGLASSTLSKAQDADTHSAGAVFVMTNNVDKNEVVAYRRTNDGALQESGRFATGGRGSGGNNDPLESQGSLTRSQDHSLLFAVNAGSGSVSVFSVHGSRLSLVDKVISGGSEPNAVAQHGNLVYVVK